MAFLTPILLLASAALVAATPTSTTNGSSGCGKSLPAAQSPPGGASHQTHFKQSDGTARTYLIHIPSNYDVNKATPLIFSFHGRTKNSSEQEELSQFSNEKWNPDAIAVYPQGIDVSIATSKSYFLQIWILSSPRKSPKRKRKC